MSAKEQLPPVGAPREGVGARRARVAAQLVALHAAYPDTRVALRHESPFQLLIAVILSAQCTDERVNLVTPGLFARFPDAASMAAADVAELEALVQSTGFFRQKAKNIKATAVRIIEVYGGEVPDSIAALTTLPGAARKTANVVISNSFPHKPEGIAVDTHVQRIARRLGWTRSWEPADIERDLMRVVAQDEWNHVTHLLIDHGRAVCQARRPLCATCPAGVAERCPSNRTHA